MATEWNESANCPNDLGQTITDELVQTYLPDHRIGLMVHSCDASAGGAGQPFRLRSCQLELPVFYNRGRWRTANSCRRPEIADPPPRRIYIPCS